VQLPQCASSDCTSAQLPLQAVSPLEQPARQLPPSHTWFAAQLAPQAPQCSAVFVKSTQAPWHNV
jgi:hypothetical protein